MARAHTVSAVVASVRAAEAREAPGRGRVVALVRAVVLEPVDPELAAKLMERAAKVALEPVLAAASVRGLAAEDLVRGPAAGLVQVAVQEDRAVDSARAAVRTAMWFLKAVCQRLALADHLGSPESSKAISMPAWLKGRKVRNVLM